LSAGSIDNAQLSDEVGDTSSNQTVGVETIFNTSIIEENNFNVTEHRGFLHGFVEALSVILVSELGDKTFFIAAILAMRNNKLTIFLAAIAALGVMTVLSVSLHSVLASDWSIRVITASDWLSH